MVSEKGLAKFKSLYSEKYGVELPNKEVFEKATQLLNFYRAVFKPPLDANINIKHEQKVQPTKN